MPEEINWLVPPPSTQLNGDEAFAGIDNTTVQDFWRFALGDLRMNNARGYLAEFLVGKALGVPDLRRVEWDPFDVLFGEITVEVKSSAFLQSWDQKKISALTFSGLRGTRFHPRASGNGLDPLGKRYNAMVYVFCAHTQREHDKYDQLDVSPWEFYVVPRSTLAETGLQSVGIERVRKLAGGRTEWNDLASRVKDAAVGQFRDDDAVSWWLGPAEIEKPPM